jgi:hypothetical protein
MADYSLAINGRAVQLMYHIQSSRQEMRIDSMIIPSKEFEQLWYRGRMCTVLHARFEAWTDDHDVEMDNLIEQLVPALGTNQGGWPKPQIVSLTYRPITKRKMKKFVVKSHSNMPILSAPGRPVMTYYECDFVEWRQWMGVAMPLFVDANPDIAPYTTQTPGTNQPTAPSVATTGSIVSTDYATGQGGAGTNPGEILPGVSVFGGNL